MRVFRTKRSWAVFAVVAITTVLVMPVRGDAAAAPPRDISRFACPPNPPNPFTDITGSVHEAAIRCGAAYGVVNGTTSTTFSPEADVTRGQFASFLARGVAASGVELSSSDQGFTDIAGNVHREAINALAGLGAIHGTTPTTFSPDALISRAQAAAIVDRLLNPPVDVPDAFTDDDGTDHEAAINRLAAVGIVSGVTADQYDPSGTLSRGAAATVLARAQDYAVEANLSFPVGESRVVRAALTGDNEVPGPGDSAGQGSVELVRTSVTGLLCITIDIDGPLSGDATAAHVHQANAGAAGPAVLTLPTPDVQAGNTFIDSHCVPDLDQSVIDSIFADPSGFYVNIHTTDHSGGAIRGQLTAIAAGKQLATDLAGDAEVPGPGESGAFGNDFLDVMADGTTVCSFLFYGGSGTPTAAHVHKAAAGAAGPVVITLPPFSDGIGSDGCIGGLDPALVADIAAHPTDYYVNVHTDAFPNGAMRGQLQPHPILATSLTGSAEVPGPGDADGAGEAFVDLIGGTTLCVSLHVRGVDKPVAAHVHQAVTGAAGPVVVELPTPIFNHSYGCVDIDPALYDDIAANPAGFYVNVHTESFPGGALRGQLAPQSSLSPTRYRTFG